MYYSSDPKIAGLVKDRVKMGWKFCPGQTHGKLVSPCGKRWIVVAKTPSDWRASLNFYSQLKRTDRLLSGVTPKEAEFFRADEWKVQVAVRARSSGLLITLDGPPGAVILHRSKLTEAMDRRLEGSTPVGSISYESAFQNADDVFDLIGATAAYVNASSGSGKGDKKEVRQALSRLLARLGNESEIYALVVGSLWGGELTTDLRAMAESQKLLNVLQGAGV